MCVRVLQVVSIAVCCALVSGVLAWSHSVGGRRDPWEVVKRRPGWRLHYSNSSKLDPRIQVTMIHPLMATSSAPPSDFGPPPILTRGGRSASKGRGIPSGRSAARGRGALGSSAPSPALLTANIKNARTMEELFEKVNAHVRLFNHIHLSACWNSIGHLAASAGHGWVHMHAAAVESLVAHTMHTVKNGSEIRARELANIAHGLAKCGHGGAMSSLMAALARPIELRSAEANEQELANAAWAFAKVGQHDGELFAALARAAAPRLGTFKGQELANISWAFATAGLSEASLFAALARVIERRLADFTVQGLANTVWAFAKAGHADASLLQAMASKTRQRVEELHAQDLAQTAWAFAKVGHCDADLFSALAGATRQCLDKFTAQGLANTIWAFAKVGHLEESLFAAFADATRRRLDECNAQDLANAAWAFAKACHSDARLFAAVARAAERCLEEFNTQDLVNTAWAFAKLGQFDDALFAAVATCLAARCLDNLSAPYIANVAWAFAQAGRHDAQLFNALTRSAEQQVGTLDAQDLASIAWAFANASQCDVGLFMSLARAAEPLLDNFNDEDLDNAEWAFAKAGQQALAKSLRQRRKRISTAMPTATGAAVDMAEVGLIVVAGGGIGGAAVAVALQAQGFDVVVLEADASFDARKQGYGLTIQGYGSTTQAMGISLAQDDAPSTSHYTFSSDGHILGFYGEAFGSSKDRRESDNSGRFVHIPRQMLRSRLVDRLRPGTIRWNSKVKSFSCWSGRKESRSGKNGVTVTLVDGTVLHAALLVASDGIHSTVRRQLSLPGDRLNYVGLIVVLGIVNDEQRSGATREMTQRRIFETVDGTTRIYAMPFTTTSTMWQLSFPCPEEDARALAKDPVGLKSEILRRCANWHEPVPALLRDTPLEGMSGYPVYDRDLLQPHALRAPQSTSAPSQSHRRVTLIGDAAHPMTPFKAQGANQALSDAVLLAQTLADSIQKHGPSQGLDVALPLFEEKMLSRSSRMVAGSREKARQLHSSLALQPARKVQRDTGYDMHQAICTLRAKGIGAHCAVDPRGLDAVVAAAICSASSFADATDHSPTSTEVTTTVEGKDRAQTDSAQGQPGASRKRARGASGSANAREGRDGRPAVKSPQAVRVFGVCGVLQDAVGSEPVACHVFGDCGIFQEFVGTAPGSGGALGSDRE